MLRLFLKDTAAYGLSDFVLKCINFATFPLFTYLLSVEEFGIYGLVFTLGALIGLFFNCGINSAVQRFATEPNADRPKIISTGLICLVSGALIVSTLALLVAASEYNLLIQHGITLSMVAWTIFANIALQINSYCLDVLRIRFETWKFTWINATQNLAAAALSLTFVYCYEGGVVGYLAGMALGYFIVVPFSLWTISCELTWDFDYRAANAILKFGLPIVFSGMGYWLLGSLDRWMLGSLSNAVEVGLYAVAFKFCSVLAMLNQAFGQAWSPRALLARQTDKNYRQTYGHVMLLWFFGLTILAALLITFGPELITLLTPKPYWPAKDLLPSIMIGLIFMGTAQILAISITLSTKTHHFMIATWISAALNILLNYYLIPEYGALGAGWATCLSSIALWTYYFISSRILHPFVLDIKALSLCILAVLVAAVFFTYCDSLPQSSSLILVKLTFIAGLVLVGYRTKIIDMRLLEQDSNHCQGSYLS